MQLHFLEPKMLFYGGLSQGRLIRLYLVFTLHYSIVSMTDITQWQMQQETYQKWIACKVFLRRQLRSTSWHNASIYLDTTEL